MADDLKISEKTQDGRIVLCGSNAYEKKYYLNPAFEKLPEYVRDELKIISVLFTEEAGGVFLIVYDNEGYPQIETQAAEEDILYDEITAGLLVKEVQRNRQELFEQLRLFYKVFILHEDLETLEKEDE